MILFIENSEDSTLKLLEPINEFSNVAGYKTNIQKLVAFLYDNEISERLYNKKSFKITISKIKYLGINLNKEVKDL